jgi:curved DNA-binding protein
MDYKDYYAILGVERGADEAAIKRAYRKLARKYHPDVSQEPEAEARFKDVAEAYEVLKDPERRAAYDAIGRDWRGGAPPPDWDAGFEFGGMPPDGGARRRGRAPGGHAAEDAARQAAFSEFFESLFGAQEFGARRSGAHGAGAFGEDAFGTAARGPGMHAPAEDHHAKVLIDLEDAFRGARQTVVLQAPVQDARGHLHWQERRLEVQVPRGVRAGQRLRLAGQGAPGHEGAAPGDLYLEIGFRPHPRFQVDGRHVSTVLRLAPWEAALGTTVPVNAPDGAALELRVPPGTAAGQRLRLQGRGIPGQPPGDLFAQVEIVLPPAEAPQARAAYQAFAAAFADFDPRPSA